MYNNKIVTFGEVLLRLTPAGCLKFSQATSLCSSFGGSETNAAVSLARFGMRSQFVTRLPKNDIADACLMNLRSHGVDVAETVFGGERLGLYYFENTSSYRTAKVVYDRANSSFSTVEVGTIDWKRIFADAGWFHWSGIGPSLSQSAADVTAEALEAAEKAGLKISSDLNYRKNLWKYGRTPMEIMLPLAQKCDVLFGTEEEYFQTFGVSPVGFKVTSPDNEEIDLQAHKAFCQAVMDKAPKLQKMFIALRNVLSANHHVLTGLLYTREGKLYVAKIYHIDHIVDCVGVGDAFAAGIIYGLTNYPDNDQKALDFAVAASTLKNTIMGDFNLVSPEEVESLMMGNGSGRIAR